MAQGGRHWNEWLSEKGSAYIEIQAGLAHTQLEHIPMKAGETWEWVEAYTGIYGAPEDFHGDYKAAAEKVGEQLDSKLGEPERMYFPPGRVGDSEPDDRARARISEALRKRSEERG